MKTLVKMSNRLGTSMVWLDLQLNVEVFSSKISHMTSNFLYVGIENYVVQCFKTQRRKIPVKNSLCLFPFYLLSIKLLEHQYNHFSMSENQTTC